MRGEVAMERPYAVIHRNDIKSLEKAVAEAIEIGYLPCGGVSVAVFAATKFDEESYGFYQAVHRP
jgi:hypothetical protein